LVSRIKGAILYQINNLSLLGEPTEETSIRVLEKVDMKDLFGSSAEKIGEFIVLDQKRSM